MSITEVVDTLHLSALLLAGQVVALDSLPTMSSLENARIVVLESAAPPCSESTMTDLLG